MDDLEEIINILKPDGEDQPPELEFEVNDFSCESIDDLRELGVKIGGRTLNLRMSVWWKKNAFSDSLEFWHLGRAELSPGGSAQRRTWVQAQIGNVFRRRASWLGKAPWLVMSVILLVELATLKPLQSLVHRMAGKEGVLLWLSILVYGVVWGLPFVPLYKRSIRSVVVLSNSTAQHGNWFMRHRDQIVLATVTSLISCVIGAVIALVVQRVLH